ncbi:MULTISPECIES: hypothetical protein [Candidatus Rhabdochlamydia]|uniref:hypothetical protein n=1 Tax=Candidatus Rhabdochlamydia TaxID=292833 RepID=UPI001BFCCDDE|nr:MULTISPECIES: hypothetical protein [Rhabdochlamydia]
MAKEALLNLNYAGKACRLNQGQLKQLKIYVKEESPSSAKQVVNFAKDRFGICYTPSAHPFLSVILAVVM